MQYASEPTDDFAPRVGPRLKRRMLDEIDPVPAPDAIGAGRDLMGERGPIGGNTGIGGGAPKPPVPPPAELTSPASKPFAFAPDSVSTLLRKYSHTPDGLKQAFAENPELAKVSQIGGSKGDKILDPTTGRWIDVITAAGLGGTGWQWLDDVPGQGGAEPQAGGGTGITRGMDPMQTNLIDQIRATLMQLMGNGQQG